MVRSIFSNWMALIVNAAIALALTPILIHGLGDFHYGMWVLVASALEHYGLLDLGIRTTLQRFVAHQQGGGERDALDQTFVTALAIALGVCVLLCGLSFLLARLLPVFFALSGSARTLFSQLVIVLGSSVALAFPAQVLGAYLCGLLRFDLFNLAAIFSAGLRASLFVAVLYLGHGVLAVAGVTLGVTAFSLLLHWRLVRWADPKLTLKWTRASWGRVRELFSFSFYVFLSTVGDYFRFRVDSVVIARWLNMALVTPFNVATRLIECFRSLVFGVMGPLMPAMSGLDRQSKQVELRHLFLSATKVTALLSLFIGALLLLNGREILRLWVGQRFLSSYALLMTLVVGSVAALGQTPSVSLIFARGQHRPMGYWTLCEGLTNLGLSIYWATKYGLMGVALGTAVPMLVVKLTIQPWYALRVAGVSAWDYMRKALARPLAVCVLFLGLARLVTAAFPAVGLPQLISSLVWETALFGLLAYLVGLNASERRFIWQRGERFALTLRSLRAGESRS